VKNWEKGEMLETTSQSLSNFKRIPASRSGKKSLQIYPS
jgi:hypothetical protein